MPGVRARAAEAVFLNVYDLHPANDWLGPFGLGFYHTGVEVHGTEYTFSDSGVFECPPRVAPGAKFRESLPIGNVRMSSKEVRNIVADIRGSFQPGTYSLVKKNCNSFSSELCWRLLQRDIPGWVNRMAYLGAACPCLFPKQGQEDTSAGGNAPAPRTFNAFGGKGRTLSSSGGGGPSSSSGSSSSSSRSATVPSSQVEERREKMRLAALKRLGGGSSAGGGAGGE